MNLHSTQQFAFRFNGQGKRLSQCLQAGWEPAANYAPGLTTVGSLTLLVLEDGAHMQNGKWDESVR